MPEPIKIIRIQNHDEVTQHCFVCEAETHFFVPHFDNNWLCMRCIEHLTAIEIQADTVVDFLDRCNRRHYVN